MDYASLECEGAVLGNYVEALAVAHLSVVEAKGRIQRYKDLRLRLVETGQIEAAEAAMPRLKDLELELRRSEVILNAASHSVRDAFDTAIARDAF